MAESERKPFAKDHEGRDVFMAETDEIDRAWPQVQEILTAIAPYMGWKDTKHVFVSDMSEFSDFGLSDHELHMIGDNLGVKCEKHDYIYEIAKKLREVQGG